MSGSHKTDDLVNDMLADMCGLIVKTIALIPPERDDDRLSACASQRHLATFPTGVRFEGRVSNLLARNIGRGENDRDGGAHTPRSARHAHQCD